VVVIQITVYNELMFCLLACVLALVSHSMLSVPHDGVAPTCTPVLQQSPIAFCKPLPLLIPCKAALDAGDQSVHCCGSASAPARTRAPRLAPGSLVDVSATRVAPRLDVVRDRKETGVAGVGETTPAEGGLKHSSSSSNERRCRLREAVTQRPPRWQLSAIFLCTVHAAVDEQLIDTHRARA